MTRWPICACLSLTPAPIAVTMPHGSWPPMTGSGLTGNPLMAAPPDLGRRYWCRSLPHIPEAFISTTTSPGPGVGSGNSTSSICRSPVKTTPRIGPSALLVAKLRSRAYAFSLPLGNSVMQMSKIWGCVIALLTCCRSLTAAAADAPPWPSTLPRYDHIIIVVEENKDYEEIIGSSAAPYLNKLAAEGATLTHMFGEEHPSEGNYFWLFSGDNQNVEFFDQVPSSKFTTSNLGEQLIKRGHSFKGYSQSLPTIGSEVAVTPSNCQHGVFTAGSMSRGSALPMFRTGRRSTARRTCALWIFLSTIASCRPLRLSFPTWRTTCTMAPKKTASGQEILGYGKISIPITSGQRRITAF